MEAAVWTMVVQKSTRSIMEATEVVQKSTSIMEATEVDPVEVQICSLNVWAWMLEDPVEILDPVVGRLPKNYTLIPVGEGGEMGAS